MTVGELAHKMSTASRMVYCSHVRDFFRMFSHKLPNGDVIRTDNLPRELAIKRMIDEERWCQEHREELEVSSQQLFDDMFGG